MTSISPPNSENQTYPALLVEPATIDISQSGVFAWHTGLAAMPDLAICTVVIGTSGVGHEILEGLGQPPHEIEMWLEAANGEPIPLQPRTAYGDYDLCIATYAKELTRSDFRRPCRLHIKEGTIPIEYRSEP